MGTTTALPLSEYAHNWVGLVQDGFAWGEGALTDQTGPDDWQLRTLALIDAQSVNLAEALQIARASGHGIGKTALIAWIILCFMSTRPHPQIVVTANTKEQLTAKTWRELAKWHKLFKWGAEFKWTATRFLCLAHPETWFASAVPWSEHRSEAFAGTHEQHVLMLFDEASAIPDSIWEVASGAMTTPGAMWVVFGNPTQNTGRFKECWGRERHRWDTEQIDSRTCKMANQAQLNRWVEDYGEDSDFVRVRVRGVFPRASSMQFIGEDVVQQAASLDYPHHVWRDAPIVLGVDVARFGDDQSVIYVRQGLQTREIRTFREIDTMQLASQVAQAQDAWQADVTFVDAVGIGAGVVDRLRQLERDVIEVNAGAKPADGAKFQNKRAEMWQAMKDWLLAGGSIPDDDALRTDLTAPEYGYSPTERLQLERKEDMKDRGLASPDLGDALAYTFALPVQAKRVEGDDYDYDGEAARVRLAGERDSTGY